MRLVPVDGSLLGRHRPPPPEVARITLRQRQQQVREPVAVPAGHRLAAAAHRWGGQLQRQSKRRRTENRRCRRRRRRKQRLGQARYGTGLDSAGAVHDTARGHLQMIRLEVMNR